jgi:ADP-ribose pyrophosphatase
VSYAHDDALRSRIVANCAAFERRAIEDPDPPRAAVAVAIVGEDEARYLFIQRALHLRRNPGQYALPGGRLEPGESIPDAARRELLEELGVDLPAAAVLGILDDLRTRGGAIVTPVVMWGGGVVELVPDPVEVNDAWSVPLGELDHPEAPRWVTLEGVDGRVLRMSVRGEWINPPTAAMLYQFREVALHGRSVRVDEVASPRWTAR